nr:unnamed protein product [Callosobruchus chinensis]
MNIFQLKLYISFSVLPCILPWSTYFINEAVY